MPSLKIIAGTGEGTALELEQRAVLGRWRGCDLQIKDPESSRRHAEVFLRDDTWFVRDLGSSNGTFVNDEIITEAKLRPGDRIRIGDVVIAFEEEQAVGSAEVPDVSCEEGETPIVGRPAAEAEPAGPPDVPGYEIEHRTRRDAVSVTYAAVDVSMGRPVAIEVLRPAYDTDPDAALARLRLAGRMEHPVFVHLYRVGCEGGRVFLVREAAAGESMWPRCGKLAPAEVAEIGAAVADALAEAHDRHLVHGSLHPDRIVRTERGHLKLTGLGLPLPKVGELSDEPDLQRAPSRIAYLSPQQLDGGEPCEAWDLYALGATLYHLLCGRPPFGAVSEKELAPKIRFEPVLPVLRVRPGTPRPLAAIIEKMLLRNPEHRPASMAEVRDELRKVLRGPAAAAVPARRVSGRSEARGLRASAILIFILGALLLASVFLLGRVGGVWFIRQGRRTTAPAKTSQTPRLPPDPPARSGPASR